MVVLLILLAVLAVVQLLVVAAALAGCLRLAHLLLLQQHIL